MAYTPKQRTREYFLQRFQRGYRVSHRDMQDLTHSMANNLDKGTFTMAILQERAVTGQAAGDFATGGWRKRDFNAFELNRGGLTVSNGALKLGPGKYTLEIWAIANNVGGNSLRVYNKTRGLDLRCSGSGYVDVAANVATHATVNLQVTAAQGEEIEVYHQCQNTSNTTGKGAPAGFGDHEVYAQITIYTEADLAGIATVPYSNSWRTYFDGVNDSVSGLNPLANVNWDDSFSVSMYLQRNIGEAWLSTGDDIATGGGAGLLLYRYSGTSFQPGGANSPGLKAYLSNGVDWILVDTNSVFANGVLHHIVVTYDGSGTAAGLEMYVDGFPSGYYSNSSKTGPGFSSGSLGTADPLRMGNTIGGMGAYNGYLDEVSWWSRVLTAQEVALLSNYPNIDTLSFAGDCLHWWRMGDDDPWPTIYDRRDPLLQGNNLAMIGMTSGSFVSL